MIMRARRYKTPRALARAQRAFFNEEFLSGTQGKFEQQKIEQLLSKINIIFGLKFQN